MIFKIRTCKETMEMFKQITASDNLQPFILSKLAISMSIKSEESLSDKDFKTDNEGLELNRQTITGEFDELYKCLIENFEGRHLNEDEYVGKYLKAHLDRGAKMIFGEYQYARDFISQLLSEERGL